MVDMKDGGGDGGNGEAETRRGTIWKGRYGGGKREGGGDMAILFR